MATETKLSQMEEFIRAFLEIDADSNEMIDKQELIKYCQKYRLDMKLIDPWIARFDTDKDNKISIEEFCRGFGLKVSEIRREKDELKKERDGKFPKLPPNIEIIAATMSKTKQYEICCQFKEYVDNTSRTGNDMREVANKMKSLLDNTYGRVWQVVLLTGSYWMNFSHEPFLSIQFKYNNYVCLAWRTPSQ
ncbi:unnamed protein product [Schistosoma rodhaini]|uniref:Tegument antigen n=1 Tax=Schistosoma mansoni TaxID=6183 RepID=TEGU_SCHMA|nr:putative 22.6 kDa tegument antigen [Schistosoma mansoni]P14202.1 RecName: Full=Tegument antigen; AltName: Full=Antigen SmA22.6; AltName: Full=I(H)A; AltName: Full=Sm22.6; AltName: Full=Tegumental-allergen-like protein-1; Short=SmTAL1; Short=TAL1 [Schistosoma mansoni]CAH8462675.1 unnamed protein product [Schistosoma rodhaini]AAA29856.1 antigen [Schistosoma mansoni]AAA29922.1 SM22.6 antigen (A12) [Schistosoma mansoni]AAY57921.1 22.6 kDa tegument antigen [Schistosoma mansoni]|eukprot:XP_018654157.1 putative 22.6 kDa tegument antigen [Schistosoma mansoni]